MWIPTLCFFLSSGPVSSRVGPAITDDIRFSPVLFPLAGAHADRVARPLFRDFPTASGGSTSPPGHVAE